MFSVQSFSCQMMFSIETFICRGIMELLSLMRIDMANFNIRQCRSLLLCQSVDYEKATFAKFMANQRGSLPLLNEKMSVSVDRNGHRSIGINPSVASTRFSSTKNKRDHRTISNICRFHHSSSPSNIFICSQ